MTTTQNRWIRWASLLCITTFCLGFTASNDSVAESPHAPTRAPSSYMPMLSNNKCWDARPEHNEIGIQIYGSSGQNEPDSRVLQNTHSAWIRNTVFWPAIEPIDLNPDQYLWHEADAALQAAKDNCINMIVTLDFTPSWAWTGGDRSPIQSDLLPEYAEFVRAMVERYDGDGEDDAPGGMVVNYWEFYNEPDFGPSAHGGGWGEFGAAYAEMLKTIYPEVHGANPNANVVLGGLAYNYFTTEGGLFIREFLDDVLEADGGKYFDIMNVHHYPFPRDRRNWTDSNSSGLVQKVADINKKLAAHKLVKPLMITEVGWHSDNNDLYPSTEEFQARHIVQLLTQAVAVDAISAIWWSLADPSEYPYKTGLMAENRQLKASYDVYRETVKRIGDSTFVKVVVPGVETDLEVYQFTEQGTQKTFYIAWLNPIAPFNAQAKLTFDDSVTTKWETSGHSATIYSKEGKPLKTVKDADDGKNDGKIMVEVGRSPIYIVIDEP
jgi:hypothetical protein